MNQTDFLQIGQQKGYIQILNEGTTIHYIVPNKRYRFKNPEEQVRARYYVELIERYQYFEARMDLEVTVPRRTPSDSADLVVFIDDNKLTPFIVVECKKDGATEAEFAQAIEQAFGNCNSLRGDYAAVIAGNTRRFFEVKDYPSQERIENIIADVPVRYGSVSEWRFRKGDPNWDLQIVDRGDLIRILEKCHDTLWESGRLESTTAFNELSKILFVKIEDEKKARQAGEPYDFQIKTHERPETVAYRVKGLYQEAKSQAPEVFSEDIEIDDGLLFSIVNHLQPVNLNQTDLDVKGVAFERFLGGYFRGDMGQYFTPREVVEFIVKMVAPHHRSLTLDPACGSGGFLLHAMDYIRQEASKYYSEDSREHYSHWHDFAKDRLFGIEVNNRIARVAKMNMIIHDDGHSNVIGNDALVDFNTLNNQNRGFEKDRFDVILTNPPFAGAAKKEERPYLDDYELGIGRSSQKKVILFLERCFDFLKWDTGELAIILPDGILNNASLQYVRDYLEQRFQMLAVVSLPQIAFAHYDSGVKSSILFLRKFSEQEYNFYQSNINRVKAENEAVYAPRVKDLENEWKSELDRGCPAQVEVTKYYRPRFEAALTNINELNQRLGKKPTKKIQSLRDRFIRDKSVQTIPKFGLLDPNTLRTQLKQHTAELTALEKEYRNAFRTTADSQWESEIKARYKEKIDTVKEEFADKNMEDIRQWVKENANYPIFMAIAEHIGYDAVGRKDPINDLDTILKEYWKFKENPDFFA